jgi:uracil-DNA glycosylase family 4
MHITDPNQLFQVAEVDGKIFIPARGNRNAQLMLIVSHPGHEDLQNKRILSGAYGHEVQNALGAAGIREEDVYITSMVKYGIGSNSKPNAKLIEDCAPILDYEIELLKPKLIMTLGAEVFKRVMKANMKQGDSLGEIVDSPYGKLLACYSPGMIINQDPKKRPQFKETFLYAKRFLDDNLNYTPFKYFVVEDPAVNKLFIDNYISKGQFTTGYDAEWNGSKFMDNEVMYTFQYSCEPHVAIVLDISKDGLTENTELLDTMKPLLEHPKVDRLGWNIRADDKRLRKRGFKMLEETLGFDGMKACAFYDSRLPKGLETGIKKFTDYEPYYTELNKIKKELKLKDYDMAKVKFHNPDVFFKYCGGDAVSHRTACISMREGMKALPKSQYDYYFNTYLPLSNYLLDLEMSGIPMDIDVMEDLTKKYTDMYDKIFADVSTVTKLYGFDSVKFTEFANVYETDTKGSAKKKEIKIAAKEVGIYEDFNPASAPQKKELLYEVMKLRPAYYTKSGKSPKPRAWYEKARPQTRALYSPSTNGKSIATIKFELAEEVENGGSQEVKDKLQLVSNLLDLTRVGVFAKKFLNKRGTEFIDEDEEAFDDEEDKGETEGGEIETEKPLKSSYWAALCNDKKIHADFFECLNNYRSSSTPNVQNPASKVLSHIPNIFVPGYSLLSKDDKKKQEHLIPRNLRHIFYSGDKDWHWAEVDVAGADLMIAAYLSKDPKYIADMLQGGFHLKKAREYFRDPTISKDDYSKYVSAKSITFRVAYTSELLQAALPIQAEIYAESAIKLDLPTIEYALNTWKSYDKYIDFREACKQQVKDKQYIENMRGMRYYFEDTDNMGILAGWLNESLAFPIASELALFLWDVSVSIKKYLVKCGVWMNWCKPVNSVHDASYWLVHKDLMKDNFFPEVCKHFFTKECKIATGDNLGMEMVVGDRWKCEKDGKVFSKETTWDFTNKEWIWKD